MLIEQKILLKNQWESTGSKNNADNTKCNLVLVFGNYDKIKDETLYASLKKNYPIADIIFCSTAGEIADSRTLENSVTVTAIQFEKTPVKCISTNINKHSNSFETGKFLRSSFEDNDLKFVFVISDGMLINGSDLVAGLNNANSNGALITGGLAGDGDKFEKTITSLNELPSAGNVIAIGFYGEHIQLGHGSLGGWDEFGPEKMITKSDKNVLYEIDNKSALDLYKEYLGPFKNELPGSALLFPISISEKDDDKKIVRTILSIDEQNKSMTFAGNMPQGSKIRLMKANFDNLINASGIAAQNSLKTFTNPDLSILISCIGRKLVLQERVDEEITAAQNAFGGDVSITGFYSYGEISPYQTADEGCELHNQTMTITAFKEI